MAVISSIPSRTKCSTFGNKVVLPLILCSALLSIQYFTKGGYNLETSIAADTAVVHDVPVVVTVEEWEDNNDGTCPFVIAANTNMETLPLEGTGNLDTSRAVGFPAFVIHNWSKSGSHFLTQTLSNLGIPVAFEYGLRLGGPTNIKTDKAVGMYNKGDACGFSGADFVYGKAQEAINGGPIDWTAILNGLASRSSPAVIRNIVLLRTNIVARTLGGPAGRTGSQLEAGFTVGDLKKLTLSGFKEVEEYNVRLVKNACGSARAVSPSEKAYIFVINYESLLIDPFTWFNKLVSFLGAPTFDETQILTAVEGGRFKRKHASTLYSDVGFKAISDNLFLGDQTNVTQSIKDCYLRQALAPFPREEVYCFHDCLVPSGMYACPNVT